MSAIWAVESNPASHNKITLAASVASVGLATIIVSSKRKGASPANEERARADTRPRDARPARRPRAHAPLHPPPACPHLLARARRGPSCAAARTRARSAPRTPEPPVVWRPRRPPEPPPLPAAPPCPAPRAAPPKIGKSDEAAKYGVDVAK